MTTTYDLLPADDFVSVEDAGWPGMYDVFVWTQDGAKVLLASGLTHDQAWRMHEAVTETLRTWEGWA